MLCDHKWLMFMCRQSFTLTELKLRNAAQWTSKSWHTNLHHYWELIKVFMRPQIKLAEMIAKGREIATVSIWAQEALFGLHSWITSIHLLGATSASPELWEGLDLGCDRDYILAYELSCFWSRKCHHNHCCCSCIWYLTQIWILQGCNCGF